LSVWLTFALCCVLSPCPPLLPLSLSFSAREISALWKAVTDSEKKKFEQAAADDKKRYEKEMADYEARGGAGDEEEAPKKKKAKAAPKKKAPEPEPESESESAESGSEEGSEDEE
jgi:hypothetical protein